MPRSVQVLAFVFTLNNPGDQPLEFDPNIVKYAVWQLEEGNNTGTPHYQGYVELVRKRALSRLHQLIPCLARAHIESRRGTAKQARDYCMKEDTRVAGELTDSWLSLTLLWSR